MFPILSGAQPINDDCGQAAFLKEGEAGGHCANAPSPPTTIDATADSTICGSSSSNSVWYYTKGFQGGDAEIIVSKVDSNPGHKMQIFKSPSCNCGDLQAISGSCDSVSGPSASMRDTITTQPDSCYYIIIDGMQGNEEDFNIKAQNISSNALVTDPGPFFDIDKNDPHCTGDPLTLTNETFLGGGTIIYEWNLDKGAGFQLTNICSNNNTNCLDSDTNVIYNSPGDYDIELRASLEECGNPPPATQRTVTVEEMQVSMDTVGITCSGTPTGFISSATMQPTGNDPSIDKWKWFFFQDCDTSSIIVTSASNPDTVWYTPCEHDDSITVELVGKGDCGPDTIRQTFNSIDSALEVSADDTISFCQGDTGWMCVEVDSSTGQAPYSFQWSGPVAPTPADSQCTSVSGLGAGGPYEYVVEVTDANGCKDFDTVIVNVNKPDITASLISTPSTSCEGDNAFCSQDSVAFEYEINQGSPPFTITWQPTQGLGDTLHTVDQLITDTAFTRVSTTTTYQIRVRDSLGCLDTTTLTVQVHPPPGVTTTPTCASDTSSKSKFCVTGACAGSSYDWSLSAPHDTLLNSTSDSCVVADFNYVDAGNYDFTVEVTDGATGCIDTVNFTYTLDTPITFALSATDTNICENECTILSVDGDTAGVTYDWYDETSQVATDTTRIEVCPDDTMKYKVVAQRGTGCVTEDSLTINVDTIPAIQASKNEDTVCTCDTIHLDGTGSATHNNLVYNWSSQQGNPIQHADSIEADILVCQSDTVTFTVTDTSTGCFSDTTLALFNFPRPAAVADVEPDTICEADTTVEIDLDGTGSATGSNIVYQWTSDRPAEVTINNADSIKATAEVDTFTNFTLTVTDTSTGCDSSASDEVYAHPQPKVAPMALPDSACACDTITLDGSASSSSVDHLPFWSSTEGNWIKNVNSYVTKMEACVSDTVELFVANFATGCVNDSSITVDVFPIPKAVAKASPDSLCRQSPSNNVSLDGTDSDTGKTIVYNWTSDRPWAVSINNADSIEANADIDSTTSFFLTATDTIIGCKSRDTVKIVVSDNPAVVAASQDSVCPCDTVTLDGSGSATGTHITYSWSSAVGNTIIDANTLTAEALVCTTDTFTLNVTDTITGCSSDSSTITGVIPPPTVVSDVSPDTLCSGKTDTIRLDGTGSATGTHIQYQWTSDPSKTIDDADSIIAQSYTDEETDYYLTVTDTNTGCVNEDTSTVYGYPRPVATLSPDTVCAEDTTSITLDGTNSDTGQHIIYRWSSIPPSPISPSDSIVATARVDSSTTFILTVEDTVAGCISTDTSQLTVMPIPQAAATPLNKACTCDTVQLDGSGSDSGSTIVYNWNSAVGNTIFDTTAKTTQAITCNTDTFTLTVTDTIFGCNSDTTIDVNVFPTPSAQATASPDTFCRQGLTNIRLDGTGSSTGDSVQYSWTSNRPGQVTINNADSIIANADIDTTTTFTLTVTDTNSNCDSSASHTVVVQPNPAVAATAPDTACYCDTIPLDGTGSSTGTAFTYNWESAQGNNIIDTSALTTEAVACSTDTFTLTVKDTTTGCFADSTLEIAVFDLPNASALASPDSICEGSLDTIRLDGGGSSTNNVVYNWTADPAPIDFTDTDSIIAQAVVDTNTVFRLTVTDTITGCDSVAIDSVYSFSGINATAEVIPNEFCQQDTTVTLDGTSGSSTGPNITYSWSSPGGVSITSSDSIVAQADVDTTTRFVLTVKDTVTGCQDIARDTLVMHPIPTVAVAPVDSVCACDTIPLDGTGSSMGVDMVYSWSSQAGNTILDADSIVAQALACQNDTFSLTVTDTSTGCSHDSSINITVNPIPSASVTASPDTLCRKGGTNIRLEGNGSSVGDSIIYSWTSNRPGQVTINNADSIIANATIDTTTLFTLTVTDTTVGCDSSAQTKVLVRPSPKAVSTVTDSACACETIILDGSSSSTGPGYIYDWKSAVGNTIMNGDSVVATARACDTDTFMLTVTDTVGGCSSTVDDTVRVFSVPGATMSVAPDTVCQQDTNTITLDGTGSQTGPNIVYNWTATPGASIDDADSLQTTALVDTTTLFSLTVTDTVTGCDSTVNQKVIIREQPDIAIQPIDSVCQCDRITLNGSGSITGNQYVYQWTSTNGNPIDNPDSLVTKATACVDDIFRLTITDTLTGCKGDSSIFVDVSPKPVVKASATPDTICAGVSTTVTLNGKGSQTGKDIVYQWSAPGTADTIQNSDSIVASVSGVNSGQTFEFKVRDTITGCANTRSVRVATNPIPRLQADEDNFCTEEVDKKAELCVTRTGEGSNYDWSVTPDTSLLDTRPLTDSCEVADLQDKRQGEYIVGVEAIDSRNSCSYTLTDTLNVRPPLTTSAGPDTQLYRGETVELYARGGIRYLWQPDTNLSNANVPNPIAQPQRSRSYIVQIDSSGCLTQDTVQIEVVDEMMCDVPNAFTPNGDGKNDRLVIHCLGESELVTFKIFNRWGEVVFRANSKHDATQLGWDGTYKGKPQEMDSYAYILILRSPEGELQGPYSGSITLIR